MTIMELRVDPEFESKISPLTEDEFRQLKGNILSEGSVLMPIIVWNGTIVDGHNRYKILRENPNIPFTVHEKDFDNRYEAISWICKNQLGRRNLTPIQKKVLIGEQYQAEKMAHGGDRKSGGAKSRGKNGAVDKPEGKRSRRVKIKCLLGANRLYKIRGGKPRSSFTILLRLNAVAERRQCSAALPNPRFRVLCRL